MDKEDIDLDLSIDDLFMDDMDIDQGTVDPFATINNVKLLNLVHLTEEGSAEKGESGGHSF